jgi:N-acetylmuramoyl-L-alanine amidase
MERIPEAYLFLACLFSITPFLYPQQMGKCSVYLLGEKLDNVDYFLENDDVYIALDISPLSSLLEKQQLKSVKRGEKIFYSLKGLNSLKSLSCNWDGERRNADIAVKLKRENIIWERSPSSLTFQINLPLSLPFETGILPNPPRAFVDIKGVHLFPAKIEEEIGDNLRIRVAQHSISPDIVRFVIDLPPSPPKVEFPPSPSKQIKISLPSVFKGKGSELEAIEVKKVSGSVVASLKLTQLSEYKTLLLKNPPRLAIDITPSYLSPLLASPEICHPISQVRWSQFSNDPPTVRVVFELKEQTDVDIRSKPSLIEVKFGSFFEKDLRELKGLTIVIDPGHGGSDPGAIGPSGLQEKDINLDIAKRIKNLLPNAVLTREDDVYITLQGRVDFATQVNADVFISVHNNALPNGKGTGTETYYFREDSLELAQYIHKALISKLGLPDGGVRRRGFYVIKNSPCPSVLIEGAYLSNPEEEKLLGSEGFRQKIAEAVVEGLKQYFGRGK